MFVMDSKKYMSEWVQQVGKQAILILTDVLKEVVSFYVTEIHKNQLAKVFSNGKVRRYRLK